MSKFSEYTSKSEANYNKHKDEQVINLWIVFLIKLIHY